MNRPARASRAGAETRRGASRRSVGGTRRESSGFTLVELMIVIAIIAIVFSAGVPVMLRSMKKDALRQAVEDIMEGCSQARADAILQGVPAEFILRAKDGSMSAEPIPGLTPPPDPAAPFDGGPLGGAPPRKPAPPFHAQLDSDIAVRLVDVNFQELMDEPEARVHFFPNGTSDEFTVVIQSLTAGSYKISLDTVTGLASAQRIR